VNNKMIGRCENCNQDYCQECTDDGCDWKRFCSLACEREWHAYHPSPVAVLEKLQEYHRFSVNRDKRDKQAKPKGDAPLLEAQET